MTLRLILPLVCNVLLVAARRPVHQDTPSQSQLPAGLPFLSDETVSGYRGPFGTFGILTIAAFVVPAGVVSVLYLIYTHLRVSSEVFDEQVIGDSREWSVLEDDFLAYNWTWSDLDDLILPDDVSATFGKQANDIKAAMLETEPLISSHERCENQAAVNNHGEDDVTNGPTDDVIIPSELDQIAKAPYINNNTPAPIDNINFQNVVEIFVTGDGTNWPDENGDDSIPLIDLRGHRPPISFKQEVKLFTVNEFRLELRPEDCFDAEGIDIDESYVSEVMVHVPGEL